MNGQQHERALVPVAEIGTWTAGMGTGGTVEETSRDDGFWDLAPVPRETMTALVSGRQGEVPELVAVTGPGPGPGDTVLADGCHAYAAARDLGIASLPVRQDRWEEWFGCE